MRINVVVCNTSSAILNEKMKANFQFKKVLLLLPLTVFILLLFSFTGKQEASKEYIIMRVSQIYMGDKSITIVYPDSTLEKVEIERMKRKDAASNIVDVNEGINKIARMGYVLKFVHPDSGDVIDYIFEKP